MLIPHTGGEAILEPTGETVTIAMSNPAGTVTVEQQGETLDDWITYKYGGDTFGLDLDNTARSIEANLRLKITAVGTGVRLYDRKKRNDVQNVIIS